MSSNSLSDSALGSSTDDTSAHTAPASTQLPLGPDAAPEGDFDDFEDTDSALGSTDAGTETGSLASQITKYREELGRTYHTYGSTEHWGPNDAEAQDQQDLSHQLWTVALEGKMFLSPLENPERILSIGTGTGIWAIDVADLYPESQVKGTDLSPIQPIWVPPNCKFEVDDYNLDWLDYDKYDLVHARELLGTVPDWTDLYRKALQAIKPGGWFEQHEPSLFFTSDRIDLGPDHVYHEWASFMQEAGERSGMSFNIGPFIKTRMEEAGFVNVTEKIMTWPIGKWAKDQLHREVGAWNQLRCDLGIRDFCARRFHNNMGWSADEVEIFCAKMRNALRNNKLFGYQWAYFVYGQKPGAPAALAH